MTPGPPFKRRAWFGGRVHRELAAVCFRKYPLSPFFKAPRRFDKIHLRDEQEEDNWSPTQSHPLETQQGDKMDLRTLQNMQRHNTDCLQVCAFCCEKTSTEQNFCILQVMHAQRPSAGKPFLYPGSPTSCGSNRVQELRHRGVRRRFLR